MKVKLQPRMSDKMGRDMILARKVIASTYKDSIISEVAISFHRVRNVVSSMYNIAALKAASTKYES
jgi:hypothetical protein